MYRDLTDEELKEFFRGERHNAVRARIFDEAFGKFPVSRKVACDIWIKNLTGAGLSEQEAKALLAVTLIFINAKVDEQDKLRARGECVRAQVEWALAAKNKKVWEYVQQVP